MPGAGRPDPSWFKVILTTFRVAMRRGRNRVIAVVAAVAVVGALIAVAVWPGSGPGNRAARQAPSAPVDPVRTAAVRWVRAQVGRNTTVACDPVVCADLAAQGLPSGSLVTIKPTGGDLLTAEVAVVSYAIRDRYGPRLASMTAPAPLAVFGQGDDRIDVTTVTPEGPAVYRRRLAADVRVRRAAGRQLLRDHHLTLSATARAQISAGEVDSRLLSLLAGLGAVRKLNVAGFDDGPAPYREVLIRNAAIPAILRYLRAQGAALQPVVAGVVGPSDGMRSIFRIRYAAPSPLGVTDLGNSPGHQKRTGKSSSNPALAPN